jgi:site-specific recombinase XerD
MKYRDARGKIVRVSTGCDKNDSAQIRKAHAMRREKEKEERDGPSFLGDWLWVKEFIQVKYAARTVTRDRYLEAWASLTLYLEEKEIRAPQLLRREQCFSYVPWRVEWVEADKSRGKYRAGRNTALLELKVLAIVMQEAVLRGLCEGNPCAKLDLAKAPRTMAPEISDEQCNLIRSKIPLVTDPLVRHMLAVSFEIGYFQGCRVNATRLNLRNGDVNLRDKSITFTTKGKVHTTAMHSSLVPLFERLIAEGRDWTWQPPKDAARTWASAKWWKFLDRHGLKEKIGKTVCFRSHRVTVITKLLRKNVSPEKIKNYLGHASTTMQEVYKRLNLSDLSDCTKAI